VTIFIKSSLSTRWFTTNNSSRYFLRVVRRQYFNHYLLVLIVVLYSALTVVYIKDVNTQTSCCRGFWWPFRYCMPSCWLKSWNPPGTSTITRDITREYNIFYNIVITTYQLRIFVFIIFGVDGKKKTRLLLCNLRTSENVLLYNYILCIYHNIIDKTVNFEENIYTNAPRHILRKQTYTIKFFDL